jgi:hypothetical protein
MIFSGLVPSTFPTCHGENHRKDMKWIESFSQKTHREQHGPPQRTDRTAVDGPAKSEENHLKTLVNIPLFGFITPIWFIGDISIVFMGFINHFVSAFP